MAAAVIAGKAPRGFRFVVTKAADEQTPYGVAERIHNAAYEGRLDELLGLCQQWAGHAVIDAHKDQVKGKVMNTNTKPINILFRFARLVTSSNQQNTKSVPYLSNFLLGGLECADLGR